MCLVQPAFCLLETTPVRATTNHETCRRSDECKLTVRPDNPGKMKIQESSSPLSVRPLTLPGHKCVFGGGTRCGEPLHHSCYSLHNFRHRRFRRRRLMGDP